MPRKWIKGKSTRVPLEERKTRRGRSSNSYLQSLKKEPSKADYEKLVAACVTAIVNKELLVYVSFSYLTKFPKDFPAHYVVEKQGLNNIVKIRAKKLLKWLQEHGHTSIGMYELQQQQRKVTILTRSIDEMFGNDVEYTFCESTLNMEDEEE